MRLSSAKSRCSLVLAAAALSSGCEPYRVEHHQRPGFYRQAAMGDLPDQITLDDGTVIKYHSGDRNSGFEKKTKSFQMREERDDGSVVLRALLPEHVIFNTLACLRNEEYELLYDQQLAERTREGYEENSGGKAGFVDYMRRHRHDLVATLMRMAAGLPHQEVSFTDMGDGVTRCRLRPQIAEPFKFKSIDVVKEPDGVKLLMIR